MMTVTKIYLTTSEVSKILGVTRVTVFRMIKAGKIKAEKIGRNFAIPAEQFAYNKKLTEDKKQEIKKIVEKAIKDYGETFKLLGNE